MIKLEELNECIVKQTKVAKATGLAKEYDILNAMKHLKTEMVNAEKTKRGLDDEVTISILQRLIKQRNESYEAYKALGVTVQASIELNEMDYLKTLLPQVSEEEVIAYVDGLCEEYKPNLSMAHMKDIVAKTKKTYPSADGGLIANIVKSKLQ